VFGFLFGVFGWRLHAAPDLAAFAASRFGFAEAFFLVDAAALRFGLFVPAPPASQPRGVSDDDDMVFGSSLWEEAPSTIVECQFGFLWEIAHGCYAAEFIPARNMCV
jgi:hypothetical protein